jgi:hypothetical protein
MLGVPLCGWPAGDVNGGAAKNVRARSIVLHHKWDLETPESRRATLDN